MTPPSGLDPLTGARSRAALSRALDELTQQHTERGTPVSVVLIDLDHLKSINDTYGHRKGDEALIAFSMRLHALLGPEQTLYRFGGDEFVVLAGHDRAHAAAWAQELLRVLGEETFGRAPALHLSVSVGVAGLPGDHIPPADLFDTADARLYAAKRLGRHRVCAEDPDVLLPDAPARLLERDATRLNVSTLLEHALHGPALQVELVAPPRAGLTAALTEIAAHARGLGYSVLHVDAGPGGGTRVRGALDGATLDGRPATWPPPTRRETDRPLLVIIDRPDLLDPWSRGTLAALTAGTAAHVTLIGHTPGTPTTWPPGHRDTERLHIGPLSRSAIAVLVQEHARVPADGPLLNWLHDRTGGLPGELGAWWRALNDEAARYRTSPAALVTSDHPDWSSHVEQRVLAARATGRTLDGRLPLVGRTRELAALQGLLLGGRVVTVTGAGGNGKTRLALQAAHELRDRFPDGVYHVELTGVPAERCATALLDALGHRPHDHEAPETQLRRALTGRRTLLLLDNYRHDPCAPLIAHLAATVDGVRFLLTAREPTGLPGETTLPLGPLPLPPEHDPRAVLDSDATLLLTLAARRARPDFTPGREDAPALAGVIRAVGGSPLGLEATAGWLAVNELGHLNAELATLSAPHEPGGPGSGVHAAMLHFWSELGAHEARALAALSVFTEGFDAPAARAVAGVTSLMLGALLDRALITRRASGLYTTHEILRQHAGTHLGADASAVHARLAEHATARVHAAQHGVSAGQGALAVDRIYPWVRAALDTLRRAGHDHAAVAASLRAYWRLRGRLAEGVHLLTHAVNTPAAPHDHARALVALGELQQLQGDHPHARSTLERALSAARELRDTQLETDALLCLARTMHRQSRYADATAHYRKAAELAERDHLPLLAARAHAGIARSAIYLGDLTGAERLATLALGEFTARHDTPGQAEALNTLGLIALERRDYPDAARHLGASLVHAETQGDPVGDILNRMGIAWMHLLRGDHATSAAHSERTLRALEDTGSIWETANTLVNLGHARTHLGQHVAARGAYTEALAHATTIHADSVRLEALAGLAELHLASGEVEHAAELYGALDQHPAANAEWRQYFQPLRTRLEQQLGERAPAALARGLDLDLDTLSEREVSHA